MVYKSIREAGRQMGIAHQCITAATSANGNQNTTGGYHWEYFKEEEKNRR